jgi:hypothetical protein
MLRVLVYGVVIAKDSLRKTGLIHCGLFRSLLLKEVFDVHCW